MGGVRTCAGRAYEDGAEGLDRRLGLVRLELLLEAVDLRIELGNQRLEVRELVFAGHGCVGRLSLRVNAGREGAVCGMREETGKQARTLNPRSETAAQRSHGRGGENIPWGEDSHSTTYPALVTYRTAWLEQHR